MTHSRAHRSKRARYIPALPSSQLEFVGEPDAGHGQQQACQHARTHVGCCAEPLPVFQHFGRFPAKAGESRVASKEADSDGHAPVRRQHHAIHGELADQAEEEAASQIDEQRAVGESAARAKVHETLEAVARERAHRAKDSNEQEVQGVSLPRRGGTRRRRSKLARQSPKDRRKPPSDPVRSGPVMANSIALKLSSIVADARVRSVDQASEMTRRCPTKAPCRAKRVWNGSGAPMAPLILLNSSLWTPWRSCKSFRMNTEAGV